MLSKVRALIGCLIVLHWSLRRERPTPFTGTVTSTGYARTGAYDVTGGAGAEEGAAGYALHGGLAFDGGGWLGAAGQGA